MVRRKDAHALRNIFKAFDASAHADRSKRECAGVHRQGIHWIGIAGEDGPQEEPGQDEDDAKAEENIYEESTNHGCELKAER